MNRKIKTQSDYKEVIQANQMVNYQSQDLQFKRNNVENISRLPENLEKYNLYKMSLHEKRLRMQELYTVFGMHTVGGAKLYELFGESYRKQGQVVIYRENSSGSTKFKRNPPVPKTQRRRNKSQTKPSLQGDVEDPHIQIEQLKNFSDQDSNKDGSFTEDVQFDHILQKDDAEPHLSQNATDPQETPTEYNPQEYVEPKIEKRQPKLKIIKTPYKNNTEINDILENQPLPPVIVVGPTQFLTQVEYSRPVSQYQFFSSSGKKQFVNIQQPKVFNRDKAQSGYQYKSFSPSFVEKKRISKSSYMPTLVPMIGDRVGSYNVKRVKTTYKNNFSNYKQSIKQRILENAMDTERKRSKRREKSPTQKALELLNKIPKKRRLSQI